MIHFLKPLPPGKFDFEEWQPFIKNKWFDRNFMKFVYVLQIVLVILSVFTGAWLFSNWIAKIIVFCVVYLVHELLHIVVIYRIGDISITHLGIFFWIHSDAVMSKKRFWVFMALPFIGLTVLPMLVLFFMEGFWFELIRYVVWINAIIAGADIINIVLIALKPSKAKFCRGYYKV